MLDYVLKTGWKWNGPHPESYGWYHIMWLVIMVVATVLICKFLATKHDKKTDDRVIFAFGCMLIGIEIYKQIFYTLDNGGHYPFYIFPYQFCSVPMFIAFIAPLVRNEKVKDAMYKFLAFFGLLAGLSVMLYPESCLYTTYITILIHTMLWHSSMVIMGFYLLISRQYGKNYFKEIIPGSIVYTIVVAIAVIANIVGYHLYFGKPELNTHGDKWFLMYVSPYYESPLPILSNIKEATPYPVFLFCYILAFVLGVSLIFGIAYLISHRKTKKKVEA